MSITKTRTLLSSLSVPVLLEEGRLLFHCATPILCQHKKRPSCLITPYKMMIGNVYFIAAVAVVGGALFGFDISSMSAIISTEAYLCYFDQGGLVDGKCTGPSPDVQGMIRFLFLLTDIPDAN